MTQQPSASVAQAEAKGMHWQSHAMYVCVDVLM